MGFGRRLDPLTTSSPDSPSQLSAQVSLPKRWRRPCNEFYWDVTSVAIKPLCLVAFLVAEGPRRVVAYATGKKEPTPKFTCARWGFRMCACGSHYYDHADHVGSGLTENIQEKQTVVPIKKKFGKEEIRKMEEQRVEKLIKMVEDKHARENKRARKNKQANGPRRRWYWPFTKL